MPTTNLLFKLLATEIQKGNEFQLSLGLSYLYEYVCALSQNRSNKIYLSSFESTYSRQPTKPSNSWIFVYMLPLKVPKLLIITEHFLYIMLTKFKTKHPPFMSLQRSRFNELKCWDHKMVVLLVIYVAETLML